MHGAILGAFCLTWWMGSVDRPPVFEFVPFRPSSGSLVDPAPQSGSQKLEFRTVETAPPAPARAVEREAPRTAPSAANREQSVPKQTQSPKVQYDDFVRSSGQTRTTSKTSAEAPRVAAVNVGELVRELVTASVHPDRTTAERDILSEYWAMLRQELKIAHRMPAGSDPSSEAVVGFDVAANGAISNVRVLRSSGDPQFDKSVVDAFSALRSIGPPPNARSNRWSVTFRVN